MLLLQLVFAVYTIAMAIPSSETPPTTVIPTINVRNPTSLATTATAAPTSRFTTTQQITIEGVTNSYVTIPAKTIDITKPTCVQTHIPDKNGHLPPGTCNAIWVYYPSFVAALVFAILYALVTALHIFQAARYKKTWCWVIIMASLWETAAFVSRAFSSKFQTSRGVYLKFQIFILLAPLWVNAFVYMTFGRMVHYFLPSRSILRIPAATLAAIFVTLDIVSFIVQLVGGMMATPYTPPDQQLKAIRIYMGGIGLQEFFIVIFVGLCIVFQREASRSENRIRGRSSRLFRAPWGLLVCAMYFSLGMITIRIIYRLIEFSGGMEHDSALRTQEAYFFVLEAVPMLLALLVFNIVHPGRSMQGPDSEMPGLIATIRGKASGRGHQKLDDACFEEVELTGTMRGGHLTAAR